MDDHPLHTTFEAALLFDHTVADGYMKHYVPLPQDVADEYAAAGITHVEGTVNGHAFRRALQNGPDGVTSLKFGNTWLRRASIDVGDALTITLAPDPDLARVDVPVELADALAEGGPHVITLWEAIAPSRRKMLGYNIENAKRPETRQRRAQAVVNELRRASPGSPSPDDEA